MFGDRHLQRSAVRGPMTGSYVPFVFCLGGNAGVVDATCTYKVDIPFACRVAAVSAGTGAAIANSPTYTVATTTGDIVAGRAVPSNAGELVDISAVATANRDIAPGDFLSVTYTDVGGATTATGFTVSVLVHVKDFPWTDAATSNEAND